MKSWLIFFTSLFLLFLTVTGCISNKNEEKVPARAFFLNITSHNNFQYVNTEMIDISGIYGLQEGVSSSNIDIKIKDVESTVSPNGRFVFEQYKLKFGKNKINVKLYVNGEVKAQQDIWIVYSDYYVEILSPFDGQVFRDGTTNINGIFEFPNGVNFDDLKIKIDSNLDATINSDGTFNYPNYSLKEGTHNLTAKIYLGNKEKFGDINEVKFYETNQNPKSKFFVTPMDGKSPLTVQIDGTESSDDDGTIARYLWDLGNGTAFETTKPILSHTYKWILRGCDGETKEQPISLQVIDNDGGVSKTHKKVITLECEPNSPPIVGEDQMIGAIEDTVLNLNLNSASDVDGDPLSYHLVDPPIVGTLNGCLNGIDSTTCEYIPMPNYFGTVRFTYKVNDGIYDSESYATVTLNIAPVNDIPVMRQDQSLEVNEDNILEFTLNGASDVDGDHLTYRIVTAPTNAILSDCISNNSDLTCKITPNSNFFGKVEFTYIVNDGTTDAELFAKVEIDVKPVNDAPTMKENQIFSTNEDESVSLTLSGAIDIEGSNLIYSIVSTPNGGVLSNCLGDTSDLTCTFTPDQDFNGQVTFTYRAHDGELYSTSSSTVTINIAPVNDMPVMGAAQNLEVDEDNNVTFNLNPANDVDGDTLTYRILSAVQNGTISNCANNTTSRNCTFIPDENFNGSISFSYVANDGSLDASNPTTVTINVKPINDVPVVGVNQILATSEDVPLPFELSAASDVEGDSLNYIIVTSPVGGTITGCGDSSTSRTCLFTPDKDFNGSVTFSYKANDGNADSVYQAIVTINIAPVNDAPIIAESQTFETNEDTGLDFTITNSSDVDGDNLTYVLVDAPTNGILSGCLGGTSDLTCSFNPNENFFGKITFSYKANDGQLDSHVVTIILNVNAVNDPPVVADNQTFETNEDNSLSFVLMGAADVENDSLTYFLVDAPQNATLTGCLDGSSALECTIAPDENYFGPVTFSYKANDGTSDSIGITIVTLNIISVNDAPIMGVDQSFTINENTSLNFDVNSALDIENSSLTYKVVLPPAHGELTGCMNNDNDLSCSYTPPVNFYGDVVIRYRAHDGERSTERLGTIKITVLMVNVAPVLVQKLSFETNEDQALNFCVSAATDSDNDHLTYTITAPISAGMLTGCLEGNNDLTCSYTPPENFSGIVTFKYKVNDGRLDAVNEAEVSIIINEINDPPTVGNSQNFTLDENSYLEFSISQGADLENDSINYILVDSPLNGVITGCLNSTGSNDCKYIPNADFKGTDFLTYIVNDGSNNSVSMARIDFTINEINRAPILTEMIPLEIQEDTTVVITLPSASDANNDAITYWIKSAPINGTLTGCLQGTTDLTCDFTPKKDFNGEVKFSYFAFDGVLESEVREVVVNVTPKNDPPVMGKDQEIIFNEDEVITFDINHANDVDTTSLFIFYSIVVPPTNGILSNCFNFTNDLSCTFTPDDNFNGEVEFTYTASDGESFAIETAKVLLNVKPVNDVPYFKKNQLVEVLGDRTTGIILDKALDADGDYLTYELVDALPNDVSIANCLGNTNNLTCDFTSEFSFVGDVTFTIRAYDGNEYSQPQKITVSVLPPPAYPIQISSGLHHTCVLMNEGDVYCWGLNSDGQLGLGHKNNIGDNEIPESIGKVSIGQKVRKIVAGGYHTCALVDSNDLKCWGRNYEGQLGLGHTKVIGDNELPSSVPNVDLGMKVKDVFLSFMKTCVVLENNELKCWGRNDFGQLGLGHTQIIGDDEHPMSVPSINLGATTKQIAAGYLHTCSLLDSGDVKCWGMNGRTWISCYDVCYEWRRSSWTGNMYCARLGTVCNNMVNITGALGLGYYDIIGDNEHPASVGNVDLGGEKAVSVSAGDRGTCALLESGKIRCWGDGRNSGYLGYGYQSVIGDDELPTAINYIDVGFIAKELQSNWQISCAKTLDDDVKCWGYNIHGALGQGNLENIGDNEPPSSIPVVSLGEKVNQFSVGSDHVCAILESNKIKCWGYNALGALGLGNTINIGDDELPRTSENVDFSGSFPTATIEVTAHLLQANENIIFNGMGSTPVNSEGAIISYEWDFGNGNTAEDAVANHTFTKAGTFEVRLIVTDDQGFVGVVRRNVIIAPEPMPSAIIQSSVIGGNASLSVDFNGSASTASEGGETIISYDWEFEAQQTSSNVAPTYIFTNPGVYSVKLTVTDSRGRTNTAHKTISVADSLPPAANFEISPSNLRAPVEAIFDATKSSARSFDGSIVDYTWQFRDGTSLTGQIITRMFEGGGNHQVTLMVTDDRGKTDTRTIQFEVLPELFPIARISTDVDSGVRPVMVNFSGETSTPSFDSGSIISYEWSFGDGSTSSLMNPNHEYTVAGNYEVLLKITDNLSKKALVAKQIYVQPATPPVANISISSETERPHVPVDIVLDASASFAGNGGATITSYKWKFEDGVEKLGATVSHCFERPGRYKIELTVTNSKGDSDTKIIEREYFEPLLINIRTDSPVVFSGSILGFAASIKDHNGQSVDYPVLWQSSNESVLRFGIPANYAQALSAGTTYISAKIGNNISAPLKVTIKDRNANPTLLIDGDYFTSNFEQLLTGGVLNLVNFAHITATNSPYGYYPVYNGEVFYPSFALTEGVTEVLLESFDNGVKVGHSSYNLRYFDGHGKSLQFDGINDTTIINLDKTAIEGQKQNISFWLRIADVSLAGKVMKLINSEGKGITITFDSRKSLLFSLDNDIAKTFVASNVLETNEWEHISLNIDHINKQVNLFQNGVLVSSNTIFYPISWVGDYLSGSLGDPSYKGIIDEIKFIKDNLTVAQIKELMFENIISGINTSAQFSFQGEEVQTYFSGLNSNLTLGKGNGFDIEDPRLRFSSNIIQTKKFSKIAGGLLAANDFVGELNPISKMSFELPPFALDNDKEISLELIDANTPGFLPDSISDKHYLIRLHPALGLYLKSSGTLTVPIDSKKYNETGQINLYSYKKSYGELEQQKPISIDINNQIATFSILELGSYFTSYDPKVYPDIQYDPPQFSDSPNNLNYDRRIKAKYIRSGSGPFEITVTGSTDGAVLYKADCNKSSIEYLEGFPFTLKNVPLGIDGCALFFRKKLDNKNNIYLKHLLTIEVSN